jgi:hypothetical protein
MSFLSDAISNAEQQIHVNTKGQVNALKQGVKGAVTNVKNNASSAVSGTVNNVVKTGIGAVTGAVGSLLTGNVSGAVGSILNAPSKIFDSALSGLGGFAPSATLQSPGTFSAMSSIGGADPGNPLAGISARPDPLMSFTWYAQLPVISPGTTQTASGASAGVLASLASSALSGVGGALSSAMGGAVSTSQAAQLPWYFVEEATMPFRQFASKAIFREGRDRNYPDKYSVDTLRLAVYADSSNTSLKYLQAWNNAVLTPFSAATAGQLAGGWGRPSDYKKPIYIYLLDVTKSVIAIVQYTECWPISVDTYQMGSNSSERLVNHVTFSVGDVFINVMDVNPDLTSAIASNLSSNALTNLIGSGVGNVGDLISSGSHMLSSATDFLANNLPLPGSSSLYQPTI